MKTTLLLCIVLILGLSVLGQSPGKQEPTKAAGGEQELKEFYDSYAEDLRASRGGSIAERYDTRGYFSLGNGDKRLVTFAEAKEHYTKQWTGPKSFEWKDLSYEVLSPESAAVAGLFDWERPTGEKMTLSYSAVLVKTNGKWRIRVEDESLNTTGYITKTISGNRSTPGPWKYMLTAQPGSAISAHKHTADMKITVKSGRKFILMGDLNAAKVQVFDSGSTFVIPANTWHVEWWENETVEEIEMVAPTTTIRAIPSSPRTN